MMTKSRRAIQVETIAALLARDYDERYHDDMADYAAEVNDSAAGWIIDVGYGSEAPGTWTRTEGIHLDDDELATAVDIAWTTTSWQPPSTLPSVRRTRGW